MLWYVLLTTTEGEGLFIPDVLLIPGTSLNWIFYHTSCTAGRTERQSRRPRGAAYTGWLCLRAAEPWPHASFPQLPRLPLSCARSAGGVVKVNDIFTTAPTLRAELSGSRGGHGALSMRHRRVCELPRHGRTHRSRSCRGCRSVVRAVQEVW